MKRLSLLLLLLPASLSAQPSPAALAAFNTYAAAVQSRLSAQHLSPTTFLSPTDDARLRRGDLLIDRLPTPPVPGALIHHWRGLAFVPGATAARFDHLLRNFPAYPQIFAPEVLSATLITQNGDRLQASMRVRQHHVLTVVLDSTYDITFTQLDPTHRASLSQSTRIAEIASPNTPAEHPLSPADQHGFLYRLNTSWAWEQRDGGLYLQIETVSLSRDIPHGLAWAVRPFVDSVPRESLEFTLRSAANALRK